MSQAAPSNGRVTTWFSSDWHIGHSNILAYSKRPFESIGDHDEYLIRQQNAMVKPGDNFYLLGDFALCDEARAVKFAKRLTGQKFIVWGNHDKNLRKSKEFCDQWIWQKDLTQIDVEGQKIILCHYAMRTWNQSHRGSWNLHGHSHGSLPDDPNCLQLDVGVDCWNYFPVSFEHIQKRMAKKTWKAIDHHGKRDL